MHSNRTRIFLRALGIAAAATSAGGCILSSTYSDAMNRWQRKYEVQTAELEAASKERDELKARSEDLQSRVDTKSAELSARG
jgi:hypothetical protein